MFHQKFGYGTVLAVRTTGWTWRSRRRGRSACWTGSWRSRDDERRRAGPLETVFVVVPEAALDDYEAAFDACCDTVGFFLDDEDGADLADRGRADGGRRRSRRC